MLYKTLTALALFDAQGHALAVDIADLQRHHFAGVRPARTSSTVCCLSSAAYGGLVTGMSNSFLRQDKVSAKSGQLQVQTFFG